MLCIFQVIAPVRLVCDKETVKERAISFTSAVSFSQALVLPVLPGRYRCLWLLWDITRGVSTLFSLQQSSLCREILWLCGSDFAVKQTQDLLPQRSWGDGMWMWALGNKNLWGLPWASKQKYRYLWGGGAEGKGKMLPSSTGLGRHRRHHLTFQSLKDQLFENCLITQTRWRQERN